MDGVPGSFPKEAFPLVPEAVRAGYCRSGPKGGCESSAHLDRLSEVLLVYRFSNVAYVRKLDSYENFTLFESGHRSPVYVPTRVYVRARPCAKAKLREHTGVNAHLHRPAGFPWECTRIN